MKLCMYGAGSIGRGFIGPLFADGGWEVVFIDVDARLVEAFNARRSYGLTIAEQPLRTQPVEGVRAVNGRDTAAVVGEIAQCDLLATALGAAVLPKVAPAIAAALTARQKENGGPLDILICENLKDAAHLLYGWLAGALGPAGGEVLARTGLVECAIGRMVPVAAEGGDPLAVKVEPYAYLPVDKAAFKGPIPEVPGLVPYTPFAYYEERKLYLHNMSHCVCAYSGKRKGYKYIWQAVEDPAIRLLVQGAMVESAAMLAARHGAAYYPLQQHADDLLYRFGNPGLADTCARVARDPLRKLAAGDRLAAPLKHCLSLGMQPVHIAMGLAAALHDLAKPWPESKALLRNTSGLGEEAVALVRQMLDILEADPRPEGWVAPMAEAQRRLRGSMV